MAELETSHVFKASVKQVFDALGRSDLYPEYVAGINSVTTSPPPPGSDAKSSVRYEINIIKTFYYTIAMRDNGKDQIHWTLIDSNMMKKNDGSWQLEALGPQETKATYRLDVAFKGFVPSMITDQVAKANLPGLFAGVQKIIDRLNAD